jgi:hypothetical protein
MFRKPTSLHPGLGTGVIYIYIYILSKGQRNIHHDLSSPLRSPARDEVLQQIVLPNCPAAAHSRNCPTAHRCTCPTVAQLHNCPAAPPLHYPTHTHQHNRPAAQVSKCRLTAQLPNYPTAQHDTRARSWPPRLFLSPITWLPAPSHVANVALNVHNLKQWQASKSSQPSTLSLEVPGPPCFENTSCGSGGLFIRTL